MTRAAEHISRTGTTESRWAYLKALRPDFGKFLHVSRKLVQVPKFKVVADSSGKLNRVTDGFDYLPAKTGTTYNIGRNKAKRERRNA